MLRRSAAIGMLVGSISVTTLVGCGGGSGTGNLQPGKTTSAPPTPTTVVAPGYALLWPFGSVNESRAWQQRHGADGSESWHLDAEQTAVAFASEFLGFTQVNRVVSRSINGNDAEVGVGYAIPDTGRAGTAAIIHLIRLGTEADAPWEVVGTADLPTFTLTVPEYNAFATSPVAVGGSITGVDESIRVTVRQPSSSSPIGHVCCEPAGGEGSTWRMTVSFAGARDPYLTVVASTGGHVAAVERFAITGVRNSSA